MHSSLSLLLRLLVFQRLLLLFLMLLVLLWSCQTNDPVKVQDRCFLSGRCCLLARRSFLRVRFFLSWSFFQAFLSVCGGTAHKPAMTEKGTLKTEKDPSQNPSTSQRICQTKPDNGK